MGLSVMTNIAAMNAYRNLSATNDSLSKSLERLSSGYRINRAADDAAGLAISEGLRSQIGGLTQAVRNTQDATSVVQTAEGALNETTSILQRMRDLSVQASNAGSLNTDATSSIQKEISQLKDELTRISNTTTFNGTKLLDGSFNKAFQVGANSGETISVSIGSVGKGMDATGLGVSGVDVTGSAGQTATTTGAISDDQGTPTAGKVALAGDYSTAATLATNFGALKGTVSYNGSTLDLSTIDYTGDSTAADYKASVQAAADAAFGSGVVTVAATSTTSLDFTGAVPATGSTAVDAANLTPTYAKQSGASAAIKAIDDAITSVSSIRADLGAKQNRFEHTINNLNTAIENTTASESRIRDTDMASEMTKFTQAQVLQQAGTAMLAQANQSTQSILKLLG
jgi:flagellin-like hook-associated protein FlgL